MVRLRRHGERPSRLRPPIGANDPHGLLVLAPEFELRRAEESVDDHVVALDAVVDELTVTLGADDPERRQLALTDAARRHSEAVELYYEHVKKGLESSSRQAESLHRVLRAAANSLEQPWKRSYFKQKEARQIVGGSGDFGAMGHVAASGKFAGLLKSGGKKLDTMIAVVNQIAKLDPPIEWEELESRLRKLRRLGNTMKAWGRVLCLARPDLYCTVSSDSFRRELAKVLSVAKSSFEEPEGYIQLIKLLHSSPWFNSPRPQDPDEAAVWEGRVAFMDGIFWAPKDA